MIFDTLSSLFTEEVIYSLMGGGDSGYGKDMMAQSFCETFEMAQTIVGYYAVAFFSMVLLSGDDDKRRAIKGCMRMAEQRYNFTLATFDFLDDVEEVLLSNITVTKSPIAAPSPNVSGREEIDEANTALTNPPTSAPTPNSADRTEKEEENEGKKSSAAFSGRRATTQNAFMIPLLLLGFLTSKNIM